jgi:formylglycine-generating enzyme required for sulfatase activity
MGSNPSTFKACGENCPVEKVSWLDAQEFIVKLNAKTGQRYFLPSEAQWEYAVRAGTMTTYPWGNEVSRNRANCDGCGSQWDNKSTAPVGSFSANAFGLHDMIGNAREWVQDCWDAKGYSVDETPSDGSAYEVARCSAHALRGGSWFSLPRDARSAFRLGSPAEKRSFNVGFRLARMLP